MVIIVSCIRMRRDLAAVECFVCGCVVRAIIAFISLQYVCIITKSVELHISCFILYLFDSVLSCGFIIAVNTDRRNIYPAGKLPLPTNKRHNVVTRLKYYYGGRRSSMATVGNYGVHVAQTKTPPERPDLIPRYQDLILDAIDQLRRRKARPDAERIYNTLSRRHSISFNDARNALDRCVCNGSVLRVEYKGNISYRNAAKKFSHIRLSQDAKAASKNKPSRKFNSILTTAFADLILQEPDYLELGVPATDLIRNILCKDSVKYTRKYISLLLEKEVETGGIARMENGNYSLGLPSTSPGKSVCTPITQFNTHYTEIKLAPIITSHSLSQQSIVAPPTFVTSSTADVSKVVTTAPTQLISSNKSYEKPATIVIEKPLTPPPIIQIAPPPVKTVLTTNSNSITAALAINGGRRPAMLTSSSSANNQLQHYSLKLQQPQHFFSDGTKDSPVKMSDHPRKYQKKHPKPKLKNHLKHINVDSNLRIGGRRKRAKKVFDPSDNNLPKKRGRPSNHPPGRGLTTTTVQYQTNNMPTSSQQAAAAAAAAQAAAAVAAKLHRSNGGNDITASGGVEMESPTRSDSGGSSASSTVLVGVCSVCHLTQKRGTGDRLISCRECSNKAHVGCLNSGDMMLRMSPDNTWQCPHCKTCVVCYETSGSGVLVVCSICADAYHPDCHSPVVPEKTRTASKWLCVNCDSNSISVKDLELFKAEPPKSYNGEASRDSNISNTSSSNTLDSPTAPHLSPQPIDSNQRTLHQNSPPSLQQQSPTNQDQEQHLKMFSSACKSELVDFEDNLTINGDDDDDEADDDIDPSIPDAADWTSNDVYDYFVQYFPEHEAKVFKEQEIDGCSLLLLKRMDVLKSLRLKLGTALKIYRHVLKLQFRRDDPKIFWA